MHTRNEFTAELKALVLRNHDLLVLKIAGLTKMAADEVRSIHNDFETWWKDFKNAADLPNSWLFITDAANDLACLSPNELEAMGLVSLERIADLLSALEDTLRMAKPQAQWVLVRRENWNRLKETYEGIAQKKGSA